MEEIAPETVVVLPSTHHFVIHLMVFARVSLAGEETIAQNVSLGGTLTYLSVSIIVKYR